MMEFPYFSTPMSCRRIKVISTLFLWFPWVTSKINTRRTSARRVEENDLHEEILLQAEEVEKVKGDQVPSVEGGNEVPEVHL